ncbi:MAG TPA: hypothetical protein ENK21_05775 [Trueperaceae bacterium]|nr:hypothetical protein [Trueperaceae bacterium]
MTNKASANKALSLVILIQALLNVVLPSFAYGYYLNKFPVGDYNFRTNFLNSAFQLFPIAIIFIFFMQIVARAAGNFDKSLKQALLDLILPFVYIAIANILYAKSIAWYLFEMGAIYSSSIFLAFLVIVFFTLILERIYKSWQPKSYWGYALMAIPQLIFLLPGIAGVYLFSKLIIQNIVGDSLDLYSAINIFAYLASLIQITIFNYRWMRKEAAI